MAKMADEEEKVHIELEVPKSQLKVSEEAEKLSPDEIPIVLEEHRKEVEKENSGSGNDSHDLKTLIERAHKIANKQHVKKPKASQKTIIVIGSIIVILSFFIWPIANFWAAFYVAVLGALVVAFGTFVRI